MLSYFTLTAVTTQATFGRVERCTCLALLVSTSSDSVCVEAQRGMKLYRLQAITCLEPVRCLEPVGCLEPRPLRFP